MEVRHELDLNFGHLKFVDTAEESLVINEYDGLGRQVNMSYLSGRIQAALAFLYLLQVYGELNRQSLTAKFALTHCLSV